MDSGGESLAAHVRAGLQDSVRANAPLLDHHLHEKQSGGGLTIACGVARGRMGDSGGGLAGRLFGGAGRRDKEEQHVIWRPAGGPRGNDEAPDGSGTEVTRCCAIDFACPADVVHEIWLHKHTQRYKWDQRTVAASRLIGAIRVDDDEGGGVEDDDRKALIVWLRSTPKPMISTRDFIYAYRCMDVSADGATRLYSGCSLDPKIVEAQEGLKVPAPSGVRAWLQGCMRLKALNDHTCRMTYCLRLRPKGNLPKFVVQGVANELVFSLFDLRKKCEAVHATRSALGKRKKKTKKRRARSRRRSSQPAESPQSRL